MPEAPTINPNETPDWLAAVGAAGRFKGSVNRIAQDPKTPTAVREITAQFAASGEITTPERITAVFLMTQFLDLPQIGAGPNSKTALEKMVEGAQFLLGPIMEKYPQIQSAIESQRTETVAAMRETIKQHMEERLKDPLNYNSRLAIKFVILGTETAAELYEELFPQITAMLEPQPEPEPQAADIL